MTTLLKSSAQAKQLCPGDRVTWKRSTGSLDATVLKITPKRVQIEIKLHDGQIMVRYVSPKNLERIFIAQEVTDRPPFLDSMVKSLHKEVNRSAYTLLWQIASGLLTLFFGGALIGGCIVLGTTLMRNYFGVDPVFLVGALSSFIGLPTLIVYTIKKQYENAFTASEAFRASVQYSIWGWIYAMSINALLMLIPLFFGDWIGLSIILPEVIFLTVSFIVIAIAVAVIQYYRLKLERFDASLHLALLGNEAAVAACYFNILPYRERIRAFWNAIWRSLGGVAFLVPSVFVPRDDTIAIVIVVFLAVLGFVGIYQAAQYISYLRTPNLHDLEATISEKYSSTYKGMTTYHLVGTNRTFQINPKAWGSIIRGYKYHLWVSPLDHYVVAAELHSKIPS